MYSNDFVRVISDVNFMGILEGETNLSYFINKTMVG